MAIIYPETFKEALPAGYDGLFEWEFLRPAFGETGVMPMDFDGVVNRYMQFLLFETKNEGVPIPKGQYITLEEAVETRFFMVIICAKTAKTINGWDFWHWNNKSRRIIKTSYDGDSYALMLFVSRWWQWASNRKRYSNKGKA